MYNKKKAKQNKIRYIRVSNRARKKNNNNEILMGSKDATILGIIEHRFRRLFNLILKSNELRFSFGMGQGTDDK